MIKRFLNNVESFAICYFVEDIFRFFTSQDKNFILDRAIGFQQVLGEIDSIY